MKGRIKSLYRQSSKGYSYRMDPLEIRGVFRGFSAKNPSGTAFAPFGKRILRSVAVDSCRYNVRPIREANSAWANASYYIAKQ